MVCFLNVGQALDCHFKTHIHIHTHILHNTSWLNENLLDRNYICYTAKAITEPQCFNFPPKSSTSKLRFWQILTQKLHYTTNFLEEVAETPNDHSCEGYATSQQFDPTSSTKVPSSWDTIATDGGHIGGPLLLYRRNNRLKIFLFIFLRESERGEAARIEKKTLHLEFHIQAWPAFLKEPLRCGFKRNTLCGTGVGSEPSMEETLQCVAAWGASDLACHLKMGAGNGTGMFPFCFFVLVLLLPLFSGGGC